MLSNTPHRTIPDLIQKVADLPSQMCAPQEALRLTPLRGREAEWRLVAFAMARLAVRRRSVIEVGGPPGMGRTRFLRELALAASQAGCVVVTYDVHDDLGGSDLAHTLTVPPGAKPVVIITDGPALFATAGFAGSLAHDTLAPDHVLGHALDHVLRPSLRVSADAPVLWVTTRRLSDFPDEAGTAITTIDLGPLGPDAVALAAADLLGVPAGRDVLALLAAAAGHPDALVELVTGLVDEGLVAVVGDIARLTATALPARSLDRVHRRLDRISTDARLLIRVVSVLDSAGDLTDVARLLHCTVAALVPVVDEALASGLLVPAGERLAFAHDLVRAEVARSLPRAMRRSLRAELGLGPEPVPSDVDGPGPRYQSPRLGVPMNLGRLDPQATQPALAADGPPPTGAPDSGPVAPPPAGWSDLTDREREIAGLVGAGLTNPEIALRLFITKDTVAYHLKAIFRKLGIARRAQLAGLVPR